MELGRIGESCLFDTVRQLHNNLGKTKFIYNSGRFLLVPYTKDFGEITQF